MPDRNSLPDLSKAEHDILNALWRSGAQSVREVHDQVSQTTGWAYTTTKTVMDRMAAKGLLERRDAHGVFVYKPLISRPQGLAKMVRFFTGRVLEMDQTSVVAMLQGAGALSAEEVEELTALMQDENEKADDTGETKQ